MNTRDRAVYEKAKADFGAKGGVVAPSYIRMEAYLKNGLQQYIFNTKIGSADASTEHKLNEQDAFRISRMGLFLMKESTTIPGIGVRQTYPNAVEFPNEGGALQTSHLEHLYNGFFSLKVGDTIYLIDQPVLGCRVINTAIELAAGTGFGGTPNNEMHSHNGFIDIEPQYTLKGQANNQLLLNVPGDSTHKIESVFGTTGYKPKLVCILLGYKITGGGYTQGAVS